MSKENFRKFGLFNCNTITETAISEWQERLITKKFH
jgi:hypothetical protein